MIILISLSLVISFIFQGFVSNYLSPNFNNLSLLYTIYILINLLTVKQYFDNEEKYIYLIIITGILTDIVYSNVLITNLLIFIIIAYFSKRFHSIFPYNALTLSISNILSVCLYHILSFLILYAFRYDNYSIMVLIKACYSSIIMTIIYTSLLCITLEKLKKKYELKEIK